MFGSNLGRRHVSESDRWKAFVGDVNRFWGRSLVRKGGAGVAVRAREREREIRSWVAEFPRRALPKSVHQGSALPFWGVRTLCWVEAFKSPLELKCRLEVKRWLI